MIRVIIFSVFTILLIIGILKLQISLSQKPNKWLGLILPGVSLLISMVTVGLIILGAVIYVGSSQAKGFVLTESSGVYEERIVVQESTAHESTVHVSLVGVLLSVGITFLLCNIPTAILLALYAANRDNRQKSNELAKMNIQDLY